MKKLNKIVISGLLMGLVGLSYIHAMEERQTNLQQEVFTAIKQSETLTELKNKLSNIRIKAQRGEYLVAPSTLLAFLEKASRLIPTKGSEKLAARILDFLVYNGADVNYQKIPGRSITPLVRAVEHGQLWAVKALVKQGADINTINTINGKTALQLAKERYEEKRAELEPWWQRWTKEQTETETKRISPIYAYLYASLKDKLLEDEWEIIEKEKEPEVQILWEKDEKNV